MKRATWFLLVVGLLAMVVGCSKPPQAEIDAANSALQAAKSAEAGEYAAESLSKAEDAMSAVNAELKAQEEKMALFRSYEKTTELVSQATQAANTAKSDAAAGKERVRQEAQNRIAQVRTGLEEARAMLATAPTGKGSQADIAAMEADLSGVELAIADMDSAFQAERYKDAIAKADAASKSTQSVKDAITAAIEAKQQAQTRRTRS